MENPPSELKPPAGPRGTVQRCVEMPWQTAQAERNLQFLLFSAQLSLLAPERKPSALLLWKRLRVLSKDVKRFIETAHFPLRRSLWIPPVRAHAFPAPRWRAPWGHPCPQPSPAPPGTDLGNSHDSSRSNF